MPTTAYDSRIDRLETEMRLLARVNTESEYVKTEPLDAVPGTPPERYRVTFLCRGIVGIDEFQAPVSDAVGNDPIL